MDFLPRLSEHQRLEKSSPSWKKRQSVSLLGSMPYLPSCDWKIPKSSDRFVGNQGWFFFSGIYTLQGINISHLGKRKIIFKMPFLRDILIPWRVTVPLVGAQPWILPLICSSFRRKNLSSFPLLICSSRYAQIRIPITWCFINSRNLMELKAIHPGKPTS